MSKSKPVLLVTGGSGYIGSTLTLRALAEGYVVHVLDSTDLPADATLERAMSEGRLRVFIGSIVDPDIVQQSLQKVSYVIHLAGVSDGRAGKADPELTRRVNAESIEHLLKAAEDACVERFIFASTMGVYGNKYITALTEDLQPNPIDPYSESKLIGEQFVHHAERKMITVSLRIAMVYGAGVRIREDFLVNKMCKLAIQDGILQVSGGSQKRPQIHLSDLVDLFLRLIRISPVNISGQIFNVVESNPSLIHIATAIRNILPETKVDIQPERGGEDSFEMSGRKVQVAIGYVPIIKLPAGIEQIINYYTKQ